MKNTIKHNLFSYLTLAFIIGLFLAYNIPTYGKVFAFDNAIYDNNIGGGGSGSGGSSGGGSTKKIIVKEITVDATKAELESYKSEISSIFTTLDSWKNTDSGFYKRYDGVVLKDAYTETYYEPKDTTTDIKHVVHHPRFWLDLEQTNVTNNYRNNWKTLQFNWKVTAGPSGAVEPNRSGKKEDSWTTAANQDTSHVAFYLTGTYTITRTPYKQWDVNKRFDYAAHIMQGQTGIDTEYHTSTIYQNTQQGEDTSQTKKWTMIIATQDLYKSVEINDTTTVYGADAEVRIIQ